MQVQQWNHWFYVAALASLLAFPCKRNADQIKFTIAQQLQGTAQLSCALVVLTY
jgi:hypothetical protein